MRVLSDNQEERMELRRHITADDYNGRVSTRGDNKKFPLKKQISVFVYKNAIYHLETITNGKTKTKILRINSHTKDGIDAVPSFIPVTADITSSFLLNLDDQQYYSQNLAKFANQS